MYHLSSQNIKKHMHQMLKLLKLKLNQIFSMMMTMYPLFNHNLEQMHLNKKEILLEKINLQKMVRLTQEVLISINKIKKPWILDQLRHQ